MGIHAIRVGLAVAAAASLAACSPQGYFELDNRSGKDVFMAGPNGPQHAPAGKVTGRLALSGPSAQKRAPIPTPISPSPGRAPAKSGRS